MTSLVPGDDRDPTPRSMKPLSARTVAVVAAVALLFTVGAIIAVLSWVGASDIAGDTLATVRLDAIKIGLSIAVGSGGVFALYLAWRRQRSNEAEHEQRERALRHQQQVADDAKLDALERRTTELYTKAADQLGSDKAPVRLAGAYALERLAQSTLAQRQSIVDVLCAYLRMPYPIGTGDDATVPPEREEERQVRVAVQRILASHLSRLGDRAAAFWPGITLDLAGATLIDFDLSSCDVHEASFDGARFHGRASFGGTTFRGKLSVNRAQFCGEAWFHRVQTDDISIFDGTRFDAKAEFKHTEFRVFTQFEKTTFAKGANFDGAAFGGGAHFYWTVFGQGSYFRGAKSDGFVSFHTAEFATANFDDAQFRSGVGFDKATFAGSAVFTDTEFSEEASFNGTQFKGNAMFGGSTFHGTTDFGYARFSTWVNFAGVGFDGEVSVFTASARIDVKKQDSTRCWPKGWVLLEPKNPEREGDGVWGELIDSAMFGERE